MKKLISLFLCLILVCFTFVGCSENIVDEAFKELENFDNDSKVDKIDELNFYIITGENTRPQAMTTVPQNINAYIKEKYRVTLNIKYFKASEYNDAVFSAMAKTDESERPDIILINSENMYNELRAVDGLVQLNDFYNSRDYRSLNSVIDDVLLAASAERNDVNKSLIYYTVPNNQAIGEYKYIVIDKAMARDTLHFSNSEISAMTTEDSLDELKAAIANYYNSDDPTYIDKHIRIVTGNYNDKLLLEYGVEGEIPEGAIKKNIVNVSSYPVATKAEVFRSAFAIVRHYDEVYIKTLTDEEKESLSKEELDKIEQEQNKLKARLDAHYSKCMRIIFALNTDVQLKNMLQYGYVGTNYSIKNEKIILNKGEEVWYEMDKIHTGNLFLNYYCEEINWDEKTHNDILRQNGEAINPYVNLYAEYDKLTLNYEEEKSEIDLLTQGVVHDDIVISWTSDNSCAVIDDNTLTFTSPEEDTKVIITATLTSGDRAKTSASITKEFIIEIKASVE